MNAELLYLYSYDIHDLDTFSPEEDDNFAFHLQAIVGPKGEKGQESFDMTVCTPKALEEQYSKVEVVIIRHVLLVQEYNFDQIENAVRKFVHSCSGETWEDVALQLSRMGRSEFENNRGYEGPKK